MTGSQRRLLRLVREPAAVVGAGGAPAPAVCTGSGVPVEPEARTSRAAPNRRAEPSRRWLLYAVVTTVTWGAWGALIELPEKAGFPSTLGYSVWALTYALKVGNDAMGAESLFAYMTVTAVALLPAAVAMTDFGKPINWGLRGPWLDAAVHLLNSRRCAAP